MQLIWVLNGPNLNLLGCREPHVYSNTTLDAINDNLITQASQHGFKLECMQTNAEHELVNFVHKARDNAVDFLIINAAAFTHTSIALRDALLAVQLPFIEVHLSNLYNREGYRRRSYLADIAAGIIMGLGAISYELALSAAIKILNTKITKE